MHFALFEVTSVAQLVQTALYPVFVFKTTCVWGGKKHKHSVFNSHYCQNLVVEGISKSLCEKYC